MPSSSAQGEQNAGSRLCKTCQDIDFEYCRHNKIPRKIILGTWHNLVQTDSCPFCCLVVRSLTSNSSQMLRSLDDTIVLSNTLSWELGVEMSPYDRLQSEAFSNKFDLRSISRTCARPAYRLVVCPKQKTEEAGYIQYIVPSSRDGKDDQFFGRAVDRREVKTSLLRSWVRRCEKFHGDICEEDGIAGRRLPANLRLIDVDKRNLIKAPADNHLCYLTLSYVWGAERMEQGSGMCPVVTNRADLRTNNAGQECTPLPHLLPRTIEDAIWLTRQLGYQYLWVDALCIVQDDPIEVKKLHLERMDAVYNCSKLTIVAASGLHADTGLPGVSVPRRHSQSSEWIGSFNMAAMCPSFSELENSRSLIWNTRGWTFQEKVLAKRILLFTDFQVYYRCSESIWTEEIVMETDTPSKSIEARLAKYRWAADRQPHIPSKKLLLLKMFIPQLNVNDEWNYLGKFPNYAAEIREYSQRNLTDQGDVLVAINGLLRTLQMDTGQYFYGLPEAHFLQSLLWHPEPGCSYTRTNYSLPTWTWASWHLEKGVVFDVLDVRLLRVIILAVQNVFIGCKKIMAKMKRSSSSKPSSGAPSSSHSSSSSASGSGSGSSSSSPSSAPFAPLAPLGGRDWTTLDATGKAIVNVALCFGLPLMFRHHTVKHVFLYHRGKAHQLDCEEPLSLSTFTKDEEDENASPMTRQQSSSSKSRANSKICRHHSKMAATIKGPVLSMKTVVVKLFVGACLSRSPPQDENEDSVFELLDSGLCVGEVWTTLRNAKRGRIRPLEFMTISWGLSVQAAEIADPWIPRWNFDATLLPKSKIKMLFTCCQAVEEVMSWNSGKNLTGTYGLKKSNSAVEIQPSVMSFFDALLTAKKGEARPKFLWSTVNLLLIQREDKDHTAQRCGVGRIIFEAWLFKFSQPEEIILA